jgi:hypothetical protein
VLRAGYACNASQCTGACCTHRCMLHAPVHVACSASR